MDFNIGAQSDLHKIQQIDDDLQKNQLDSDDCIYCCHFHSISNPNSLESFNAVLVAEESLEYKFIIHSFRASPDNPPPIS